MFGFASAALRSAWPITAGALLATAYYAWHWHGVRLEPISPELVARARRAESTFGIVAFLSLFLN